MELYKWLKRIKIVDVHIRTAPVMVTAKLVMHTTTEIPIAKRILRRNKHEMPIWHIKMRNVPLRKNQVYFL